MVPIINKPLISFANMINSTVGRATEKIKNEDSNTTLR